MQERISVPNSLSVVTNNLFRGTTRISFSIVTGLIILLSGCKCVETRETLLHSGQKVVHATGYQIRTIPEGYRLSVTNPWQGNEKMTFAYTLVRRPIKKSRSWTQGKPLNIPVHKVICTSTTHIAFLRALGKLDCVAAISGTRLVTDSVIRKKIADGVISDVGYDRQLDVEKIVSIHPDVVFMYGIDEQFSTTIHRLETLGIPAVIVGDYLEPTLLSRLDWIRFFGAFFDETDRARHYYDSVSLRYTRLSEQPVKGSLPGIMTGLPWNEVWYISGRGSLLANTINDAGGTYLFSMQDNSEALPWDIEKVYRVARHADIWINAGSACSLTDIMDLDSRLEMFSPFQRGMVFNNNKRLISGGGNDYWESGVICPDRILEDLRSIFHPGSIPGHTYYYYRQLQEQ
jgi:iron complex transport system substrate-binding protein